MARGKLTKSAARRARANRHGRPLAATGALALPTDHELVAMAADVSLYTASGENVSVFFRDKSDGGYRPIMDFGLHNRARQLLAAAALKPYFDPHPGQYILGRGRAAACRAVTDRLNDGFKWVVGSDVPDCFGSFDLEGMSDLLPLPRRVVENVIATSGYTSVEGRRERHIDRVRLRGWLTGGRRGIPQGAHSSSLVAEFGLKPLLDALPTSAEAVAYGDNFLVLTRTEKEARMVEETLSAAARQHSVGRLELHKRLVRRACDGFRFLGYEFRTVRGVATARPTDAHLAEMRKYLDEGLLLWSHLDRLAASLRSWAVSFELWDRMTDFEDHYGKRIAQAKAKNPTEAEIRRDVEVYLLRRWADQLRAERLWKRRLRS